jgi:hypothetical protein
MIEKEIVVNVSLLPSTMNLMVVSGYISLMKLLTKTRFSFLDDEIKLDNFCQKNVANSQDKNRLCECV